MLHPDVYAPIVERTVNVNMLVFTPLSVAVTPEVPTVVSLISMKILLIVSFYSGSWFISASVIVTVTSDELVRSFEDTDIVPTVSEIVNVRDVEL